MKCDELKAETIIPQGCTITLQMYPKAEVDSAIAELKDKSQMHDFFWEGCGFAKRGFKNTIAVSEAFDKLEAENTELKAENERLKKQSSCTFSDDSLRVRQLKRKIADNSEKILELQKALDVALSEVYSLLDKIESLKAPHYAESVDAGMRERKLKRALWLVRALRARDIQRWWIAVTCSKTTERACSVWNNVERKCREKAEEYK